MQLTLINDGNVTCLEVSPDLELENFIALCDIEMPNLASIPHNQLLLVFNGIKLNLTESVMKKQLQTLGLKDGDAINVEVQNNAFNDKNSISSIPFTFADQQQTNSNTKNNFNSIVSSLVKGIKIPNTDKKDREMSKRMFDLLKQNDGYIDAIRELSKDMANVFESNPNDYEAFHCVFLKNKIEKERRDRLMMDETSEEGQKYIAEIIAKENIEFNHQFAIEHMPEAFIPVHMLYIRIKINGMLVIAFVDSGAQVSILSEACAIRCNISRLIDKRYCGTAMGVGGSQKFLGRIHSCQVQVEGHIFPCPFSVIANRNIDILFGLNALRRHQCSIDLKKNVLRFGDGTETPFLHEEEYNKLATNVENIGRHLNFQHKIVYSKQVKSYFIKYSNKYK